MVKLKNPRAAEIKMRMKNLQLDGHVAKTVMSYETENAVKHKEVYVDLLTDTGVPDEVREMQRQEAGPELDGLCKSCHDHIFRFLRNHDGVR